MATKTQIQIWLDEAEIALHALQVGEAIVQISGEGRTTIYNQSAVGELKAYISELKNKLNGYSVAPVSLVRGI